jgi:hypothetical protein
MRIESAILLKEMPEPDTPPSGEMIFYVDSADGKAKYKNSAGTIVILE